MRIAHILASTANEAAGPTYSVRRIAEEMARRGHDVDLVSLGAPKCTLEDGLRTRVFRHDLDNLPLLKQLFISKSMRGWLGDPSNQDLIVHAHGLWLMPNVYPSLMARKHNQVLIHSPRGMLGAGALKFSRRKKLVFGLLAQDRALAAASCIHVTSEKELEDVRAYGLKAPVAVIPNGIDIPTLPTERGQPPAQREILYLGRLHPKKAIDRLLIAWSRLEACHPDWRVRIVGPSEAGYVEELKALAGKLGLARVEFHPGLFGAEKDAAYRDADVFVLPTLDENFGMVVVEALAWETPVICSKGAPWLGLETHGCGWWVDHGADALEAALREAIAKPRAALAAMGARGRAWVNDEFTWHGIASDMLAVYRWCLGVGERPACVVN